jgi:hypothetical protein
MIRFAAGIMAPQYRHQQFERDEFVDTTTSPPTSQEGSATETFDMVGAEVTLEFEVGPRPILAGFFRGRAGGEYVLVMNDGLEPLVDREDTDIHTAGVHGTVEAGVISQFIPNVEIRAGYRYHRQEVFQEMKNVITGPNGRGLSLELPDNTTELQMVFIEAAFVF